MVEVKAYRNAVVGLRYEVKRSADAKALYGHGMPCPYGPYPCKNPNFTLNAATAATSTAKLSAIR